MDKRGHFMELLVGWGAAVEAYTTIGRKAARSTILL